MKTKTASIHKNADAISQETDELQREIADALLAIENALQGAADAAA